MSWSNEGHLSSFVFTICNVTVLVILCVSACRSPKHSSPVIKLQHSTQFNYWLVEITCGDRNKLFFDTVCSLADLHYDVFHGTIDSHSGREPRHRVMRPRKFHFILFGKLRC